MKAYGAKLKIMKLLGLKIAILAVLCSAASSWAGDVGDTSVRNCTWCHGTSGQGFMVAPRLAGQRPQYLESQLRSFHAQTRDNPFAKQYMWGATAALPSDAARNLANYFSTISPRAANDGNRSLVDAGGKIYNEGIPDANIVACVACHGPDAVGVREIPRLGGLSYSYLKRRLREWGEGYHSGTGFPMPQVATSLGPNEIEALASYLSFVRSAAN
jgi:cytochrome c553